MANNCFVDFYITTRTNIEAARLIEILYKNISEANKRNQGAFIGSKTRYIFDAGVYSHTAIVVKVAFILFIFCCGFYLEKVLELLLSLA